MDDARGHRHNGRGRQRLELLCLGRALQQAFALQGVVGPFQLARLVAQAVGGVQRNRHGRAHGKVDALAHGAQPGGHLFAQAVFHQHAGELFLHALGLFAFGHKEKRFHLHQPGGHFNELAGALHLFGAHTVHDGGVLVDELYNFNIGKAHLVFADKV